MGRSYEFDPEHGDKRVQHPSRSLLKDNKEKVTRAQDELPEKGPVQYGKRFAQTEQLYQARLMDKQLEELAGLADEPKKGGRAKGKQKRKAAPKSNGELPSESRMEELTRSKPIGALPPTVEQPRPAQLLDVLEEARRHGRAAREAIRDLRFSSVRLLLLPLEVARVLAARLLPTRA